MFSSSFSKLHAIVIGGAVMFAVSPASATLQIQISSGANTYSQTGANPLVVVESIGNFTTTVNTGTMTAAPSLDLSSLSITSSAGGTLIVTLSGNDFSFPFGLAQWQTQFSGNFAIGHATVTLRTYLDNSNTLMGTATPLGTLTAATTPSP